MLNLLKKPISTRHFDAWSKIADDIAKVAILTIPVILYGNQEQPDKSLNLLFLAVIFYVFLALGRLFRDQSEGEK